MKYRKDVLIARIVFVLLIALVIGIAVSVASRISASKQNQQQVAEVVEETERNEIVTVDDSEFAVVVTESEEEEVVFVKTTAEVNFRKDPSTDGEFISLIPRGSEVELLGEDGGWSKVLYNETTGYVNSNYVEKMEKSEEEDADITPMITTTDVKMREHPSSDSNMICYIGTGTELNVFNIENDWAKIYYNGQTGYVSAQYLRNK